MEIKVSNVNCALEEILWKFKTSGILGDSRNGAVVVMPEPVLTTYTRPEQRVLFSGLRDANPFFHLFESLWMLGGYNDVEFPAQFAKQLSAYSDDGTTLNGAYGHRWRRHFGYDQIHEVIQELLRHSNTRRAVLAMWDGAQDIGSAARGGKDVPCNTHIYFSISNDGLDMTVCCRSNDAVWGAYGANAVHFSMLQQFIAEVLRIPIGMYRQFSNNMHIYVDRPDVQRLITPAGDVLYAADDRYEHGHVAMHEPLIVLPLMQPQETSQMFLADIHRLVWSRHPGTNYVTEFFVDTIAPMQEAHRMYRAGAYSEARGMACDIRAQDWMMACVDWLDRREEARRAKEIAVHI